MYITCCSCSHFWVQVAIREWSFSALSRIAAPRTRMTHWRQRNLVLLAFEKSRTKKIDLDELVLRLCREHNDMITYCVQLTFKEF